MNNKSWLCALAGFFIFTTHSLYAETSLVAFVDNSFGKMILLMHGESQEIATSTLHTIFESTDWKASSNVLLPSRLGAYFAKKHISTTEESLARITNWDAVRMTYAIIDQQNLATVIELIKRHEGKIVECTIKPF